MQRKRVVPNRIVHITPEAVMSLMADTEYWLPWWPYCDHKPGYHSPPNDGRPRCPACSSPILPHRVMGAPSGSMPFCTGCEKNPTQCHCKPPKSMLTREDCIEFSREMAEEGVLAGIDLHVPKRGVRP